MRHARRAAKVDDNQPGIIKALRSIPGCFAQSIGQPYDLLVGFRGTWFVLEVKDPSKPRGDRELTTSQVDTLAKIRNAAPVFVVENIDEALCAIGAKQWPEVGM